jgi:hypothetical protein
MLKLDFEEVFHKRPNGTITPKKVISVNDIIFGHGIAFGPDVPIGGVDFFIYQHLKIAGEEENGILVIKGFYKD